MDAWAIDLGTTHTVISYWLEDGQVSHILDLPKLTKITDVDAVGLEPALIPSALAFVGRTESMSVSQRLGSLFSPSASRSGEIVGRAALDLNLGHGVIENVKSRLGHSPCMPVLTYHGRAITVRDAAQTFIKALVSEVKSTTGHRIRRCAFTVPIDSFDCYRTELKNIARAVGIRDISFIDEPVAAALGYGLDLQLEQTVLVADFGGGSLDFAAVRLSPRLSRQGRCDVLAKASVGVGGHDIDRWLAIQVLRSRQVEYSHDESEMDDVWTRLLLREGRRVKEQVSVTGHSTFDVLPHPRNGDTHGARYVDVDASFLDSTLNEHGFYERIETALDDIHAQLVDIGTSQSAIQQVLLVGGTTLLPGVRTHFNDRFGPERVRQWCPFSAVASGGAAFSADVFKQDDFIVHDYALAAQTTLGGETSHIPIIKRGTRYPTDARHFAQQFTPSCPLGVPEVIFKLVIFEIAHHAIGQSSLNETSGRHALRPNRMALNGVDPILGRLEPPHQPGDPGPRLDVSFFIDKHRWLRTTVIDLKTGETLLEKHPVAQLL